MADYKKIAEEALRKANASKGLISSVKPKGNKLNESVLYPDGLSERMHPSLEDDIVNQKTSLGKHPIFPEGDEYSFEQKIMGDRFKEVVNRYKSNHETHMIDTSEVKNGLMPNVKKAIQIEKDNKKALEDLAIKMVREEFDMDEDVVEIHAELMEKISLDGTKKNPTPVRNDMEFKNHDEMINAKEEVYKRRFVNAMIQGAAKKCNHMFHMAADELADIDPKLTNLYSKIMSAGDYLYYIIQDIDEVGETAGIVRVEFPTKTNPKIVIHAQAMVFPVLIHELVKGVMEVISAKGLPKKKLGQFIIDKADFVSAEPWDMRIGPALWGRLTDLIGAEDFNLKHHVWSELVSMPVKEFTKSMREIMAGTKEGKKIIKTIIDDIKHDLKGDEFNETLDEISGIGDEDAEGYDWGDLMGPNNDESEDDGYEDLGNLLK